MADVKDYVEITLDAKELRAALVDYVQKTYFVEVNSLGLSTIEHENGAWPYNHEPHGLFVKGERSATPSS